MAVYSFNSFIVSMIGPGLAIPKVQGSTEDGIILEAMAATGSIQAALDGSFVTSKFEDKRMKITMNVFQNSPVVSFLQIAKNLQDSDPALFGANTIIVTNPLDLSTYNLVGCIFSKQPNIELKQAASGQSWEFEAGSHEIIQGVGL